MSIKIVPGYTMQCDWPGCEVTADDDGDYAFWGEPEGARLGAEDIGRQGKGDVWFCDAHPCAWDCDYADAPVPAPLVLIRDADGLAQYVEHLHDGAPCVDAVKCPTYQAAVEASQHDEVILP